MITLTLKEPDGYSITATIGCYGVYLDTDILITIAQGPAERRDRFVASIHKRGVLLFSEANLAEGGALNPTGGTGL